MGRYKEEGYVSVQIDHKSLQDDVFNDSYGVGFSET